MKTPSTTTLLSLALSAFLAGPFSGSAQPGTKLHEFITGSSVLSSPAIGTNGTIYVGSCDNNLYAFNPDGTTNWVFATGDRIFFASPAVALDGTIYVGSEDGSLYSIKPNGATNWVFAMGSRVDSSPAIHTDGTVYIGAGTYFYAVNRDGTKRWEFVRSGGRTVGPTPAAIAHDGTIYVGMVDGYLYALNPDGTVRWSFDTGSFVGCGPAIGGDGTVYVSSYGSSAYARDGKLFALDRFGRKKWEFDTGGHASGPAIGVDGKLFCGVFVQDDSSPFTGVGKFFALNSDGTMNWEIAFPGKVISSPAVSADGTIHFGGWDGNLYALNPNGTTNWIYHGNPYQFQMSAPNISADGVVYIGSGDGKLYAFQGTSGLADTPWPAYGKDRQRRRDMGIDSDQDCLSDYEETNIYHTDPNRADTDGDGLGDYAEVRVYHTNPLSADSDGDGYNDSAEIYSCHSPVDANDHPAATLCAFTAIELEFVSKTNTTYFIQASPDLVVWTNFEGSIIGDGNVWKKTYSSRGTARTYYRVELAP